MFAQKLLPASLKNKVCVLTAAFALSSSLGAQEIETEFVTGVAVKSMDLIPAMPVLDSAAARNSANIELCRISVPTALGNNILKPQNTLTPQKTLNSASPETTDAVADSKSIWSNLDQILATNINIKDPRVIVAAFNELFAAENFKVKDCSRADYANFIVEQLRSPHQEIFQGKRATCGATNIQMALAKFEPELFVRFAITAAISGQQSFELKIDDLNSIVFKIPEDSFVTDNSRRSPVSRVVQSCLMEKLNGENLDYSNSNGYHYNEDGSSGRGVSMESAASLLSELRQAAYLVHKAPFDETFLLKLADLSKNQPILVSLNWRQLSEDEISERINLSGGNKDNYVSKQGYLGHMLSFVGLEAEHVLLSSTWHRNTHKKYDHLETIGPTTTPIGRYDYEKGLIKIPVQEFFSRVKKIAY